MAIMDGKGIHHETVHRTICAKAVATKVVGPKVVVPEVVTKVVPKVVTKAVPEVVTKFAGVVNVASPCTGKHCGHPKQMAKLKSAAKAMQHNQKRLQRFRAIATPEASTADRSIAAEAATYKERLIKHAEGADGGKWLLKEESRQETAYAALKAQKQLPQEQVAEHKVKFNMKQQGIKQQQDKKLVRLAKLAREQKVKFNLKKQQMKLKKDRSLLKFAKATDEKVHKKKDTQQQQQLQQKVQKPQQQHAAQTPDSEGMKAEEQAYKAKTMKAEATHGLAWMLDKAAKQEQAFKQAEAEEEKAEEQTNAAKEGSGSEDDEQDEDDADMLEDFPGF